jgi:hypothetical protein
MAAYTVYLRRDRNSPVTRVTIRAVSVAAIPAVVPPGALYSFVAPIRGGQRKEDRNGSAAPRIASPDIETVFASAASAGSFITVQRMSPGVAGCNRVQSRR